MCQEVLEPLDTKLLPKVPPHQHERVITVLPRLSKREPGPLTRQNAVRPLEGRRVEDLLKLLLTVGQPEVAVDGGVERVHELEGAPAARIHAADGSGMGQAHLQKEAKMEILKINKLRNKKKINKHFE